MLRLFKEGKYETTFVGKMILASRKMFLEWESCEVGALKKDGRQFNKGTGLVCGSPEVLFIETMTAVRIGNLQDGELLAA